MIVNLYLTPKKTTPELAFKDFNPYFNWLRENKRTPSYIACNFPELFSRKEMVIPLDNSRATRKFLAEKIGTQIKNLNCQLLANARISENCKKHEPLFEIIPQRSLMIPSNSKIEEWIHKLRNAKKIITNQEIFVYFAAVHQIPCLAFCTNWNQNQFKNIPWIKLYSLGILNGEKIIKNFLTENP